MRTRTGVVTGLGACLGVAALAVGAFAWVTPRDEPPAGFRAYLDLSDAPVVLDVSPAELAKRGPITATSSLSGFLSGLSGIPDQLLAASVASAADEFGGADAVQVVRSMAASVRDDGSTASTFSAGLVTDDGLVKVAEIGSSGLALWYSPPQVELPADLTIGHAWSGNGSVNGIAAYEYEGRIEAANEEGCINTATTSRLIIEGSDPFESNLRTTWCLGRGSTASVDTDTGLTVSLASAPIVSILAASAPPTPRFVSAAALPFLSPTVSLPAVIAGDVLVLANSSSQDLVAVQLVAPTGAAETADDEQSGVLPIAWLQHPGGEILGVTGDGQNVYVTSTTRTVTSFNRAGGLRWSMATSDVAGGTPAVLGDVVVIATLDGSVVALDLATGAQRWSRTMSDAVVVSPVTVGDLGVVADIAGRVSAFDADGAVVWSADVDAVTTTLSSIDGAVLVGDDSGVAHLFDEGGGELWSATLAADIAGSALLADDVIIVPTKDGLQGLDRADGSERWLLSDWPSARVWNRGTRAIATMADRVAQIDAKGTVTPIATALTEPDGDRVASSQVAPGLPYLITLSGSVLPWPGSS